MSEYAELLDKLAKQKKRKKNWKKKLNENEQLQKQGKDFPTIPAGHAIGKLPTT